MEHAYLDDAHRDGTGLPYVGRLIFLANMNSIVKNNVTAITYKECEYCDIANGTCIEGGCMQG